MSLLVSHTGYATGDTNWCYSFSAHSGVQHCHAHTDLQVSNRIVVVVWMTIYLPRDLGIEYAEGMFGFEQRRGGGAIPRIVGVFVCTQEAELVEAAAIHKVITCRARVSCCRYSVAIDDQHSIRNPDCLCGSRKGQSSTRIMTS